jgi:predicted transposase YbfD/YdcC
LCWRNRGVNTSEHEGELTVAPIVLADLPVRDRLLTGDAAYCQRSFCQTIVDRGGDYLVIVKENQPDLYASIALLFDAPPPGETFAVAETHDRHGDRTESRWLWASTALTGYLDWPGVQQVLKVKRVWQTDHTSQQVRYAITSQGSTVQAQTLLAQVRGHWAIENRLHYVRDVSMGEDASQVRSGSAPEILAGLRNAVLAILRSAGWGNAAEAFRSYAWRPQTLYALLGLPSP